jgi:formylmethanofuran dehydrogenase subunit E
MMVPERDKMLLPRTASPVATYRCPECREVFAAKGQIRTPEPLCPRCLEKARADGRPDHDR